MSKLLPITFCWSLTQEGLERLFARAWPEDGDDLCGKVFFGNFVIELIWDQDIQTRTNCFVLGWDNYDYLGDDPYGECDDLCFSLPKATSLKEFRNMVEAKIISILQIHPDLLTDACIPTDVSKWSSYSVCIDHTHNATIEAEVSN